MSDKSPSIKGNIQVGNLTNVTGVAIGHQAETTITQASQTSHNEIAKVFVLLKEKVNSLPEGPNKTLAQTAVGGLETEAEKGDQAEEGNVSQWFNFLAQTAPDAWDVAISTFVNPILGLGLAFKKVAERAKQERQEKSVPKSESE